MIIENDDIDITMLERDVLALGSKQCRWWQQQKRRIEKRGRHKTRSMPEWANSGRKKDFYKSEFLTGQSTFSHDLECPFFLILSKIMITLRLKDHEKDQDGKSIEIKAHRKLFLVTPQVPDRLARFLPGSWATLLCDGLPWWWRPHASHDAGDADDDVHGQDHELWVAVISCITWWLWKYVVSSHIWISCWYHDGKVRAAKLNLDSRKNLY